MRRIHFPTLLTYLLIVVCLLILGAVIAQADPQQPFDKTVVGLSVGYDGYHSQHVVPAVDVDIQVGKPVLGFQPYSYSAFEVLGFRASKKPGMKGNPPVQLQVLAVTGAAMIRPLGEYVYIGALGAGGIAGNGSQIGGAGEFGGIIGYRLGKSQHWSVAAVISADKTMLTSLTPVAFVGVRYGFGGFSAPPPQALPKGFKKEKR